MKKILFSYGLMVFLMIPGSSFAQEDMSEAVPTEPYTEDSAYEFETIRDRQKKVELALQWTLYHYQGEDKSMTNYDLTYSTPEQVEKNGVLWGGYGSYTWRRGEAFEEVSDLWEHYLFPNFLRVELDAGIGEIDYETFATGKLRGRGAWNVDGRILAGYDFMSQSGNTLITPYTGFGYYTNWDDAGGWEDHWVRNYVRFPIKHDYMYIPIGLEVTQAINQSWDMQVKMEGDFVVGGDVKYFMSDIEGTFAGTVWNTGAPLNLEMKNVTSSLKGGYGLRFSTKLVHHLEKINVFFEPFLKYWYIKKTKPVQSKGQDVTNGTEYVSVNTDGSAYNHVYEPKNYTLAVGGRLGVQF